MPKRVYKRNRSLDPFREWLLEEGVSERTAATYARCVMSAKKGRSLLTKVKDADAPKSTKTLYRSALIRWAEYTGDDALLAELQSAKVARMVKQSGKRLPKRVHPLPPEDMARFLAILEELRGSDIVLPWVWPVISLFRKLALRAGVDLCQVRRDSVVEALSTGVLQIWTKGERVREVPTRQVREELHALLELGDWEVLADVISPRANPETRLNAAYRMVTSCLRGIAEAAGLDPKEIHSHRFRHTRAMELYRASKDIRAVQQFLGHKSVETTQRYLQIDMSEIDDYLDDLD